MLRAELDILKETGRGDHIDAWLTRYALVNFLIRENSPDEALELIAELEYGFVPKLADNDPMRDSLAAMKACAQALERKPLSRDDVEALKQVKAQLDSRHLADATSRLVDRVAKVIEERTKGAKASP
jgi:hypothetical protein